VIGARNLNWESSVVLLSQHHKRDALLLTAETVRVDQVGLAQFMSRLDKQATSKLILAHDVVRERGHNVGE